MNLLRPSHLAGLLLTTAGLLAGPALHFDGIVLPFKEVVVASPVQSSIQRIGFKEGDSVQAGDVLARLYSRIEELDMLRAKAALEKREFDFKGSKNLYADKIISEDEALKGKIELELARLQFEQAAELFNQRTLLAPIGGILVEQMREVGESVTPSQPMFRLVDINQVYVQFYMKSEQLGHLKHGDRVTVICPVAGSPASFEGTIDFIDPRVDAASGLMRIKVLVPNHDRAIKPGLRAEVVVSGS